MKIGADAGIGRLLRGRACDGDGGRKVLLRGVRDWAGVASGWRGPLYRLGPGWRRADGGLGPLRQAWVAGLALLVASIVAGCGGGTTVDQSIEPGQEWRSQQGMRFVWIPAGRFEMGSPVVESGRDSDEVQHEVRISRGFWMGKHEVTQGVWQAVMGSNPSRFRGCGPWCPVESVSWGDIQEFIGRLNRLASGRGYRYRLPTEAEWEYAVRAGKGLARYSNLSNLGTIAWYWENSGERGDTTQLVGQKVANGWGLHDMLGNVWEWTADWYGAYPTDSVTDPEGPVTGAERVIRGGGWIAHKRYVRSAGRDSYSPSGRSDLVGFRLVRTQ